MKTSAVTTADLSASVFAVPPLARHADLSLDRAANTQLIRYIETGGVSSILYGGNANMYNIGIDQFAELLDLVEASVNPQTWVIPSVGPDFGRLMEQAKLLKGRAFPCAMLLPLAFPTMPAGVCQAIERYVDNVGKPLILYLKSESWLRLDDIEALVRRGQVCGIKYAIPRQKPQNDPYLRQLIERVGHARVVCGLAEGAAQIHMRDFGLPSFTSGGVCIAPRLATRLLRSLQAADDAAATRLREAFMPLERFRERTQVFAALHEAVQVSGIAAMGAPLPMLAGLDAADAEPLPAIVAALMRVEAGLAA